MAQCVAFEKYDGTNLHWVWDRDFGWHAFGMRRNRYNLDEAGISEFNANHKGIEQAPEIFCSDFGPKLEAIFRENPDYDSQEITVFTEFLGPGSFAGQHLPEDPKELVLFDVETSDGMVEPNKFVEDFGELKIARVVYRGKLTGKFVDDVRMGKYGVDEGVICKGGGGRKEPWMVKIKTNAYMERLREVFKADWESYWE